MNVPEFIRRNVFQRFRTFRAFSTLVRLSKKQAPPSAAKEKSEHAAFATRLLVRRSRAAGGLQKSMHAWWSAQQRWRTPRTDAAILRSRPRPPRRPTDRSPGRPMLPFHSLPHRRIKSHRQARSLKNLRAVCFPTAASAYGRAPR